MRTNTSQNTTRLSFDIPNDLADRLERLRERYAFQDAEAFQAWCLELAVHKFEETYGKRNVYAETEEAA